MMDVARARAELAAIETENVQLSKPQYEAMLTTIERGQRAENALVNARTMLNAFMLSAGIPA